MVREGPLRRKHWGKDLKKDRSMRASQEEQQSTDLGTPRSISEPKVEGDDKI